VKITKFKSIIAAQEFHHQLFVLDNASVFAKEKKEEFKDLFKLQVVEDIRRDPTASCAFPGSEQVG